MNRIVRFVPQIIVAVITMVVAQAGPRSRVLDEDGALALLEQTLKHDGVYAHRISLDCITTAPRRQPALIFSLCSAKITTPNAVETPKRAPQSIATGFIVSPEKLNGWNGRKTTGNHITQRKSDNADSLLVTRLATVPILKKNRL